MRSYKQKTKVLGIPVHGLKDGIFPEVELRKWQLVENILLAATRSLRNCVFDEGLWTLKPNPDDTVTVMLSADAATLSPSVTGVARGIYFAAGKSVVWPNLPKGKRNFLYLATTKETRLNPLSIRTYSRVKRDTSRAPMLMAVVDLTEGKADLNKHPDGKRYAETMSAPGTALNPKTVEFESAGRDGVLLKMNRKVEFVQVSRMHAGDFDGELGEVSIGYFERDNSVEDSRHVMVYNNGRAGIPLRAIVFSQ